MNGERSSINGERILNGLQQEGALTSSQLAQLKAERQGQKTIASPSERDQSYTNGQSSDTLSRQSTLRQNVAHREEQAPLEILQLISKDSYLPLAALIGRAAQSCWNDLSGLIDQLASIHVPDQTPEQSRPLPNGYPNNQSKANLEKKEKLLQFANDQKADFIKLLVLLQWSRDVDDVSKTISINYWLMTRRQAYWDAISMLASLKHDSAGFQIPNPDLKTAAETLSRGHALGLPTFGYLPRKDLSNRQMLTLLKSMNRLLAIRLSMSEDLPVQLRKFHIHDGRATFVVPHEFELDVSILDESTDSRFRMVDFRFLFSPAPSIPDNMRSEIEQLSDSNIDRDGLQGCYLFLHELALSYKLAEYHKQALELARTHWAGNLRVELIRRTLVVQYWSSRQTAKSWVEIGITSGHPKSDVSKALPFLDVKWMRHGKRVAPSTPFTIQSVLSLEDILRQVIAQDATLLIDGVYDGIVATPLFADSELSLEQTVSDRAPEDCSLTLQLFRSSELRLKIDAVTGSFVISPVTERSERLQYEINRIHGVGGEVASKLLSFRCSMMEAWVNKAMLGTKWEILRAFKFSQSEMKTLFGIPIVRLNMYRQIQWGSDYFLAISHAHNGDDWWLLQQTRSSNASANIQAQFQVIRTQRIGPRDKLTIAYFDQLSEYATGLICLRRNADYLSQQKESYDLPALPSFDDGYKLPDLVFTLDLAKPISPNFESPSGIPTVQTKQQGSGGQKTIKLSFDGIDRTTNLATLTGRIQIRVNSEILRQLDTSILDSNVALNPTDQSATISVNTSVSEAAIPIIADKAVHLENIISTVYQIHRMPGVKLQTLSNSGFAVIYHQGPPKELSVKVSFRDSTQPPQLNFFPSEDNPHALLADKYSEMLALGPQPFASKVRDFLTSMTMTYPLLSYLHSLQQQHGRGAKDSTGPPSVEGSNRLRIHLLVRSVQHFAVQYFTNTTQASKEMGTEQQQSLLARLEILPHLTNGSQKPMWLIRAALEEFQAYSRPSYSTSALRTKLRQEIFSRTDRPTKWLALDSAAACLADEPEALLKEVHGLLSTFVEDFGVLPAETDATTKADAQKGQSGNVPNGTAKPKAQARPQGKMQAPGPAPNGAIKPPQQRANNPGGRPFSGKGQVKPNVPNNQDNPITLD